MEIVIFYIAVVVAIVVSELAYIPIAARHGWTSDRNRRQGTHEPAIVGGGVVFYVAAILWSLGTGIIYTPDQGLTYAMVGLTMLAACSFFDDLYSLPVAFRLLVQAVAVSFAAMQFGIFAMPMAYVCIFIVSAIGITNGFNFMDGINGMLGLYSFTVLAVMLGIDLTGVHFMSGSFIALQLVAIAVYLYFNLRRHSPVFAGDVGSVPMGYIFCLVIASYIIRTLDYTGLIFIIIYAVDVILTILRRIAMRQNIFMPHKLHLYQTIKRHTRAPGVAISITYSALQLVISVGYLTLPGRLHQLYFWSAVCVLTIAYFALITALPRRNRP